MVSTKLVCIKQKSPTLPTKYPTWNAGLRQSRGFFVKNGQSARAPEKAVAHRQDCKVKSACAPSRVGITTDNQSRYIQRLLKG